MLKKYALLAAVSGLIVLAYQQGWLASFTLESLQAQKQALQAQFQQSPWLFAGGFFVIYILLCSLPVAVILTLAAGAIFGFWQGLLLVSFASSLGALLAFSLSRYWFRDSLETKFKTQFERLNDGINRDGWRYLLALRLVPLFPFFLINLVMGLTKISAWQFYWVSQVGMFIGTAVFVNAGTAIASVESTKDILSPQLIFSLSLLGLIPLVLKKILATRQPKQLNGYQKPKSFDNNLVIIGGGAAGLVSAIIASTVKAKVTLIEKHQMGGDCLNTGCVPSKALIRSSHAANEMRNSTEFGLAQVEPQVNFSAVMARVQRIIKTISVHDSVERFESLGVNCLQGEAEILSPWHVKINGAVITTRRLMIATGASPLVPKFDGLEQVDYYTSETLWQLEQQPKRFLVLGAGPIGAEIAQAMAGLGSQVSLLDQATQLLPREDADVGSLMLEQFRQQGVDVQLSASATGFGRDEAGQFIRFERDNEQHKLYFDAVFIALGRKANVKGFGLENLNIELNPQGQLEVDEHLQTSMPGVYACGDVVGPYQFTHMAAHQAWYACVNALFGGFKRFKVDYSVVPWATYVSPEVARVGLSETDAKAQGLEFEISTYMLEEHDRAQTDSATQGFVKVLTPPGKDKILGVTIVAENASEMIAEYVLAMKHGLGLNKILATIHIYPTMNEANKFAAGIWKKKQTPEFLLPYLQKYFRWQAKIKP